MGNALMLTARRHWRNAHRYQQLRKLRVIKGVHWSSAEMVVRVRRGRINAHTKKQVADLHILRQRDNEVAVDVRDQHRVDLEALCESGDVLPVGGGLDEGAPQNAPLHLHIRQLRHETRHIALQHHTRVSLRVREVFALGHEFSEVDAARESLEGADVAEDAAAVLLVVALRAQSRDDLLHVPAEKLVVHIHLLLLGENGRVVKLRENGWGKKTGKERVLLGAGVSPYLRVKLLRLEEHVLKETHGSAVDVPVVAVLAVVDDIIREVLRPLNQREDNRLLLPN